jgi:4-amino-4-deoxy-L-arabinose transferase-like glycosyltransferase
MNSLPFAVRRRGLWLLVFLFAVIWFGSLDYRRLIDPDEGRYAEIPREMVVSGDWLTPRLNDLKYFEKPPLQYWATAAAYVAFGEHHWTARLWSALTGFLGVLFTLFASRRLFDPTTGWIAGMVLASSFLWNAIGHVNTLDMGVSALLSAAVFALCLAQRDQATPQESRRWQDGAWALLALATLSKGLIGIVLPAATVVLYALWQRDVNFILRIRPLRGLGILLLITAPWFIAVSVVNPEFAYFFFIHEHVERFLTKVHGRYEPVWYFIPVLLAGMLPWLASLLPGLKAGLAKTPGQRFQPQRFLLLWSVCVFAFFSLSDSKLASYILPIFPALAALIALHLDSVPAARVRRDALLSICVGLLGLSTIHLVVRRAASPEMLAGYHAYQPWLYAAAGLFVLGGFMALFLARRHRLLAVAALAVMSFCSGQAILLGHDSFGSVNSAHDIALAVREKVPAGVPFFSVDTYHQSFQFYLGRTTTMVSYADELGFGVKQEPQKFIPDMARFAKVWQQTPEAWAMMSPVTWDQLKAQGLPMVEVARDSRRIIVRKP